MVSTMHTHFYIVSNIHCLTHVPRISGREWVPTRRSHQLNLGISFKIPLPPFFEILGQGQQSLTKCNVLSNVQLFFFFFTHTFGHSVLYTLPLGMCFLESHLTNATRKWYLALFCCRSHSPSNSCPSNCSSELNPNPTSICTHTIHLFQL